MVPRAVDGIILDVQCLSSSCHRFFGEGGFVAPRLPARQKTRSGVSATMAENRRCHSSNAGTYSVQTTISSPFYTPKELIDFKC